MGDSYEEGCSGMRRVFAILAAMLAIGLLAGCPAAKPKPVPAPSTNPQSYNSIGASLTAAQIAAVKSSTDVVAVEIPGDPEWFSGDNKFVVWRCRTDVCAENPVMFYLKLAGNSDVTKFAHTPYSLIMQGPDWDCAWFSGQVTAGVLKDVEQTVMSRVPPAAEARFNTRIRPSGTEWDCTRFVATPSPSLSRR